MSKYRLGRILQVIGMIVLPVAIASELAKRVTLGQSMVIATSGAALFLLGTRLSQSP
jgi:hypothetical protein